MSAPRTHCGPDTLAARFLGLERPRSCMKAGRTGRQGSWFIEPVSNLLLQECWHPGRPQCHGKQVSRSPGSSVPTLSMSPGVNVPHAPQKPWYHGRPIELDTRSSLSPRSQGPRVALEILVAWKLRRLDRGAPSASRPIEVMAPGEMQDFEGVARSTTWIPRILGRWDDPGIMPTAGPGAPLPRCARRLGTNVVPGIMPTAGPGAPAPKMRQAPWYQVIPGIDVSISQDNLGDDRASIDWEPRSRGNRAVSIALKIHAGWDPVPT